GSRSGSCGWITSFLGRPRNVDRAWTGRSRASFALLSFQRPRRETPVRAPPWTLKTALGRVLLDQRRTLASPIDIGEAHKGKKPSSSALSVRAAHRQDSKGTRWMPWHQETKKDVDGCDKPR